jgi:putative hydrolase of the HAD superfamily
MCAGDMIIHAVIFDLGGTLEDVYYDDDLRLKAMSGLQAVLSMHSLNLGLTMPELYAVIKTGMKKYGQWREQEDREASPEQIWTEFVFADYRALEEKISVIGEELAFYWDTQCSTRTMRPEAPAALDALHARGYRLGVISNIMSRRMVPYQLKKYGIAQYFQVVLASTEFGWRKPSARIFLEAARQIGSTPSECAYVGDTISRDVIGARRAGYGLAIQIKSFLTTVSDKEADTEKPDAVVQNLTEVVGLIENFSGEKK